MKCLFSIATMLSALFFLGCHTQAQPQQSFAYQIDSLLQLQHPRKFNGTVVVQQNGKVLYAKAIGFADMDKQVPLGMDDKFSTMSIAKQVTATLVLRAVAQGSIDLHIPIKNYLADLHYAWADSITMHQLLNHTSGLSSFDIEQPLKFKPGTAFSYSNIGYSLAGRVLEKQTSKSFEALVTELFQQCGMEHSAYYSDKNKQMLVKGHAIQNNGAMALKEKIGIKPEDFFCAHLMVTAKDLANWNEHLHRGKLLQPHTYQMMIDYAISAEHPLFGNKPIGYGYGLRINNKQGFVEIGHTGYHPSEGFTAVNLYYPETRTSIVVLENQAYENFDIAYFYEKGVRDIILQSNLVAKHKVQLKDSTAFQNKLYAFAQSLKADVGIAILGPDGSVFQVNELKAYPMMSTFKFPIALTVLHKVEQGTLSMNQKIFIKKAALHKNTVSPFRDKHPNGNIEITVEEALEWMVCYSDNNLTDVLLELVGGTKVVSEFINSPEFVIRNNEADMHKNWEAQFVNTISPKFAMQLLHKFEQGKMLNPTHTQWLYQAMVNSKTGLKRLKGQLPEGTLVAQRAGTSFTNKQGITGAINNIGIVELAPNQKIYIAVYVRNIAESFEVGESLIAEIAKAAFDYYQTN